MVPSTPPDRKRTHTYFSGENSWHASDPCPSCTWARSIGVSFSTTIYSTSYAVQREGEGGARGLPRRQNQRLRGFWQRVATALVSFAGPIPRFLASLATARSVLIYIS